MKKKLILILMSALLCALMAACSGGSTQSSSAAVAPAAQKFELKMSYSIAATDPTPQLALKMAERISERTQGNFVLQNYPNGELAGDVDSLEQIARGSNILSLGTPDFLATYVPDIGALDGPYLFTGPDEFKKLEGSEWFAGMRAKLEALGIKNISMSWYFGARHLTHKLGRLVKSPADLKGVRIRSATSPMRVAMTEAMGATVTQMNWNEVYSALNQGVMDGCEAPLSTLFNSKIYEVCKDISLTAHIRSIWSVNVSKQWFDTLSKDYQDILVDEVDKAGAESRKVVAEGENDWRKKLEGEGVRFTEVDEAAFRKACSVVYDKMPQLSPGIFNTIRDILDK
jgi:tripartite ATP-independent transporter DctP family solute receptor